MSYSRMPAKRRQTMPERPHPVSRLCLTVVSASALLYLTGCQSIANSPSLAEIRVIDASPDAPGLDIYEGTQELVGNLGFGTITSYVPTDPGAYSFSVKAAGTVQTITSARASMLAGKQYTLLVSDSGASLQELILTDQNQPAPSGQIAVRFIDQASRIGAVDIYLVPAGQKLTAVVPVLTNLALSDNTGYINIPTGTYTLVVVPTGTVPVSTTIATYSGPQVTYTAGSARTVILIDQQLVTTPGMQVITADDYDSPTAVTPSS